MARKRADGEGSIYKRIVPRKDGTSYIRWEAALSLGYDDDGKRKRLPVSGRSQAEVLSKLEEIKKEVASGIYTDEKCTVSEYLKVWLNSKPYTF